MPLLPCPSNAQHCHLRNQPSLRHPIPGTASRCCVQAASSLVPLPPPTYNYKADILPETQAVISRQYPQLQDLVDQGNLVIWQRPAAYQERRSDGYKEPLLIFLLGTAHVSAQSAEEVHRVVQAVQPACVVVELCKSRVGVLAMQEQEQQYQQQLAQQVSQQWQQPHVQQQQQPQALRADTDGIAAAAAAAASSDSATNTQEDEGGSSLHTTTTAAVAAAAAIAGKDNGHARSRHSSQAPSPSQAGGSSAGPARAANLMSLSGSNFLSAVSRSAQLGGQSGLLLRLLLAGPVKKAADQLGVQPGAEFKAAAVAADAVGASLVLGDRPIEITLQRAWEALSWRQRLQLLSDLLAKAPQQEAMSADRVEQLRSDDAISSFFNALSERYPELILPLIAERDLYLAWSLKRSKAVNGAQAVVGVLGKGHLRGVTFALKHDSSRLRFADLVGGKSSKGARQEATMAAVRRLLVEALIGVGLYAAWVAATAAENVGPGSTSGFL